jgi:multimeric flavodoxin WrbA
MKALIFNCTLKKSPAVSNTGALIDKVTDQFTKLGVTSEVVRIADYNVSPGTSSDEGDGDEWPKLLPKVRECDIFIIATPIWVGFTGSIAQRVIERLDAVFHEEELMDPETGQTIFYGKVGGVIVTGNEDGAHGVVSRVVWALNEFGCTIPPTANTYWVGKAGPGPSYLDDEGTRYLYTNKTLRHMTHNLAFMAGVLKKNPNPTNLNALTKEAEGESNKEDA